MATPIFGTFTWSIPGANQPPGLNIDPNSGVISGKIAVPGETTLPATFNFTVMLSDSSGAMAMQPLSIVVQPPIAITTSSLPSGVVGTAYSTTISAAGGAGTRAWGVAPGDAAGLTIDSGSGTLSWPSPIAGPHAISVLVTDTAGGSFAQFYTLTINPPFGITTTSLPGGIQGASYNQTLATIDPTGSVTWSISGSLPAGLNLNAATGAITGTPTGLGVASFTVMAADSGGHTSPPQPLSIAVSRATTINYVAVSQTSPGLARISADGQTVTTIAASATGADVAQDASGNFIVAAGSSLQRVTPAGAVTTIAPAPTVSTWVTVAVDGKGNYIVGDNTLHELWSVSPDGVLVNAIAPYPVAVQGTQEDVRIAIDVHGNYIVAEDNTDVTGDAPKQVSIIKVTPAGAVTSMSLSGSSMPATVSGLTLDRNGNYLVQDQSQETVFQIAPTGVTTVFSNNSFGSGLARNPLSNALITAQSGSLTEDNSDGTTDTLSQSSGPTLNPLSIIATATDFPSVVDSTNPLAYFRLQNLSGVSEINGYTYNYSPAGSLVNAGPPINQPNGTGAQLDGSAGDVTTNLAGQVATAGSLMAWVNLAALPSTSSEGAQYVLGESQVGNDFDVQFQNDNKLYLYTAAGSNINYTPSTSNLVGQWHLIVAMFDASVPSRSIFWDGSLVATDNGSSNTNKAGVFEIGESSVFTPRFFNGEIAETAVWNYALTPAEVFQIYASGAVNFGTPAAPQITSVSPASAATGAAVTIAIAGTNLDKTTAVWFTPAGSPTTLIGPSSVSATQVTATIPVTLLSPPGTAEIAVANGTDFPSNELPFTIGTLPASITTLSLPPATGSAGYSYTLTATGGSGKFTWTQSGLPDCDCLSLSSSGTISGTAPPGPTSFPVTFTLTDNVTTLVTTKTLTLNVTTGAPAITTSELPGGTQFQPYTAALSATGSGKFQWSVTSETSGLNLGFATPSLGELTGTPTVENSDIDRGTDDYRFPSSTL